MLVLMLVLMLCLQIRLMQHELDQDASQREKVSERCKQYSDKVREVEEELNLLKKSVTNARMEAAEFGDSKSDLVQIVGSLRKQLREAVNEIGLVQREVVGSVGSVERTVAELVADQRAKLRETEEELATVTRELQSAQRVGSDVRDQHQGAVDRVADMEQKVERLDHAMHQVSQLCVPRCASHSLSSLPGCSTLQSCLSSFLPLTLSALTI